MSKARLAKLQQALNASDPEVQHGVFIIEYEKDGSVSIYPIGFKGTKAAAEEFLAQKKYDDWVRIINDVPRLEIPRPDGRTLKIFTEENHVK